MSFSVPTPPTPSKASLGSDAYSRWSAGTIGSSSAKTLYAPRNSSQALVSLKLSWRRVMAMARMFMRRQSWMTHWPTAPLAALTTNASPAFKSAATVSMR